MSFGIQAISQMAPFTSSPKFVRLPTIPLRHFISIIINIWLVTVSYNRGSMHSKELEDILVEKESNNVCTRKRKLFGVICAICIVVIACVTIITCLRDRKHSACSDCGSSERRDSSPPSCNVTLVESIPENLTFPKGSPTHQSVFHGLLNLLEVAESSIHIASSYWTMRGDDVPVKDSSSWQGEKIFRGLIDAGKRGNTINLVR